MSSHFTSIGLRADGADSFAALVGELLDAAAIEIVTPRFNHLRWTDPSGAVLAGHVDATKSIECVTPFFAPAAGATQWRVQTHAPSLDSCIHCSGADCDILDSSGTMVTRATIQWLHFLPFQTWLKEPRTFSLDVVAFAHAASFYDDEAAFDDGQSLWFDRAPAESEADKRFRLASAAFLPEGMFAPAEAEMDVRAISLFSGRLTHCETLINRKTGASFMHVRVDTLPGPVDVVVDLELADGVPAIGKLALVRAWVVGHPNIPPSPPKQSWIRRLLST